MIYGVGSADECSAIKIDGGVIVFAEFGSGQVLWSMFWFFLIFIWIWLLITVFADIIRSKDLDGWSKAAWTIGIIVLPYLGVFIYLIARGGSMTDRTIEQVNKQEEATQAYIRDVAGSGSADELAKLAELHKAGTLDDAEYTAAKAKVIG
ncbi:MAG: SHOCT domain-containing protein [Acidobacteria bacterium]|nr:SHOCT domain-containing protein [Acidobacteriota bacterium]